MFFQIFKFSSIKTDLFLFFEILTLELVFGLKFWTDSDFFVSGKKAKSSVFGAALFLYWF